MIGMIAAARWGFPGFTSDYRGLMLPRPWAVDVIGCDWSVSDGVTVLKGTATSHRTAMRVARQAAVGLARQSHPTAT